MYNSMYAGEFSVEQSDQDPKIIYSHYNNGLLFGEERELNLDSILQNQESCTQTSNSNIKASNQSLIKKSEKSLVKRSEYSSSLISPTLGPLTTSAYKPLRNIRIIAPQHYMPQSPAISPTNNRQIKLQPSLTNSTTTSLKVIIHNSEANDERHVKKQQK